MKAGETNLEQARGRYYGALMNVQKIATVSALNALRDAGREYARVIVDHSHAVMDWLTFADTSLRETLERDHAASRQI